MEKLVEELDIKGLEEEIDSAVERLFVDKKDKAAEGASKAGPEKLSPLGEGSKTFDLEEDLAKLSLELSAPEPVKQAVKSAERKAPPPSLPRPASHVISEPPEVSAAPPVHAEGPSPMTSLERMETHLLSLEWEITKENLERTKEEVVALRGVFKEKPDVNGVLNLMEKVLTHMSKSEEGIQPPVIKFLLDATETMKLLMRREDGKENQVHKQLLCGGLQARFLSLEGVRDKKGVTAPAASADGSETMTRKGEEVEKILNRMSLLCEKLEGALKKLEKGSVTVEREANRVPPPSLKGDTGTSPNITIFRIGERLFGIESHKVFKLFKVPETFRSKYSKNERIRLKDLEMRLIDLKKIFSIPGGESRGEMRILAVKESGELKGFIIDQVLQQVSAGSHFKALAGEYFLGVIRWPYKERTLEVPVLNVKTI